MNISIVSVFPDIYQLFLKTSLIRRAQESGIVSYDVDSYSNFSKAGSRIDAPSFGHGAGMLIKPCVVQAAVEEKEKKYGKSLKIFFSPHGKKLDQVYFQKLAKKAQEIGHVMLLPARYEGMDARVEQEYADEIVSLGDFVLMGGDLPVMVFLEGMLRLVPGVVGKKESIEKESFSQAFVDHPEFTEPVEWKGYKVPDVVRSGNHGAVDAWRENESIKRSVKNHFDWVRSHNMTKDQKEKTSLHIPPHYVVLMHDQVIIDSSGRIGASSVTSIDIHDIARSAKTYGIKNFFIVTPLKDQHKIVKKLIDFWHGSVGKNYNKNRYKALQIVKICSSLQEVIEQIELAENVKPLVVTTSARVENKDSMITYYDQEKVWQKEKPVLLLFGTAQGLSSDVIKQSDYLLLPVYGFSAFNHLSVRSAVAIILDRWLGINIKQVK